MMPKDIEFKSRLGQHLYMSFKNTLGDKESFKKAAMILLKEYLQNK
jgi:hypothetical protein